MRNRKTWAKWICSSWIVSLCCVRMWKSCSICKRRFCLTAWPNCYTDSRAVGDRVHTYWYFLSLTGISEHCLYKLNSVWLRYLEAEDETVRCATAETRHFHWGLFMLLPANLNKWHQRVSLLNLQIGLLWCKNLLFFLVVGSHLCSWCLVVWLPLSKWGFHCIA